MSANMPITELDWIAVDWGTSSLRIWAMARDGTVLARRSSADGMGTLSRDGYEDALLKLLDGVLPKTCVSPVPVIVCGMAGAKTGWAEAGYRQVPCAPLAVDGMVRVPTRDGRIAVQIFGGLCQKSPADVMRGEETQIAGLVSRASVTDAIVCMPGTHSKWVRLVDGKLVSFTTFMTGELFAVMAEHSILRLSVSPEGVDQRAFITAVHEMLDDAARLSAALFSIRAAALLEGLEGAVARSRLSGLLIGAEIAGAKAYWRAGPVHIVGADRLAQSYGAALDAAGASVLHEDAEALTLAGLGEARKLCEAIS